MTILRIILIALGIAILAACQPNLNPNSYDYYGGTSGHVQEGVIQDIQYNVDVRKNSGVGTIAGGIAGGALGSHIGGSDNRINTIGVVGGAIAGGLAGRAVESAVSDTKATLYIVRLKNSGRLLSVIQKGKLPLCKGDHVYLISAGGRPRLRLNDNYYSNGLHTRRGCLAAN